MSQELIKTLNKKDATDALVDLGEIAIDQLIETGVVRDIPILGTLVKLKNFGLSISDHFFIKKLQRFVFQLNSISDVERDGFYSKIASHPELQSRVNDNLFLLINAADDIDKPSLLGKIFAGYISGKITYDQFMQYSTSVNSLNVHQLKILSTLDNILVPSTVGHAMATFGLVIISIPTMAGSSSPEYFLNELGSGLLSVLFSSEIDFY